jgi:hypothetical protein
VCVRVLAFTQVCLVCCPQACLVVVRVELVSLLFGPFGVSTASQVCLLCVCCWSQVAWC